jgi:RHS repeat-associated protein
VNQYVWHPHYVDALAMRRYDANQDGNIKDTGEGAFNYLQDANYNVTAIVRSDGTVAERYAYTAYGTPTILNGASDPDGGAEWSVDTNGSDVKNVYLYTGREYDWETGLQNSRNRFYASHLGRWLTRDPLVVTSENAIAATMATAAASHIYQYVRSMPLTQFDPSGLLDIPSPCGTFSWDPYQDPGRTYPGWEVGFDPTGCKCSGYILVQVIEQKGTWGNAPFFDIGKKVPPNGTKYPGYCETGGRCAPKKAKFPNVDGPIQDAPDQRPVRGEGHNVTICAVCVAGGKETVLGCVNFTTTEDLKGFESIEPSAISPCRKGSRFPAEDPNGIWDTAEEWLDDGTNAGLPIKWTR